MAGAVDMFLGSRLHPQFERVGRDLFLSGAVTSHGGNMSVTDGEYIWITRTNSRLGDLSPKDVVATTFSPHESMDQEASREIVVHRAMYEALVRSGKDLSSGMAIVHAHTRHTIVRSMLGDGPITAADSEGSYTLGAGVPIVSSKTSVASEEAARKIAAEVLKSERIVMLKGHGPFSLGATLEDAWRLISVLEASCEIAWLCHVARGS